MSEKTFEQAMNRLDEIVSTLESGNATMDETIVLFEEGMQLVSLCDTKLKHFETSIKDIIQKNEGTNA